MPMITPQPYPAYRTSGVEWLGDVPEHWEVRRLKQLCSKSALYGANIAATQYQEDGVRFLRTTDITDEGHLRPGGVFLSEELVRYYLLKDKDLLISRSGTVGRSFLYQSKLHGPCAYAGYLVRFIPNELVLSEYIFQFTRTQAFDGFLIVMAISSTIENVNADKYANAHLTLPPLHEQAAIVRYLDYVDRRVRRYLRAKEKLIGLLEEEKQAIINQAVTRGLDPSVRRKPSGVEWLGDVPEHWERRRLKSVLRPIDERSTTGDQTLLSLRRDHGVVVYAEHFKRPPQSRSLVGFKLVRVGQLVVNRLQANNGLVFDSKVGGLVSPDYSVFEERIPIQMQYLSDLLRISTYRAYFRRNATGLGTGTSGFLRLYDDALLRTPVFLPPVTEQRSIIKHLAKAYVDRGSAIHRARRQIDLVEEYRTRLIADVVTGKLDVREAAAALPDATEAPDGESDCDRIGRSHEADDQEVELA